MATNGPHAELATVPATVQALVPDGVAPEQACFASVTSVALQGIRLADGSRDIDGRRAKERMIETRLTRAPTQVSRSFTCPAEPTYSSKRRLKHLALASALSAAFSSSLQLLFPSEASLVVLAGAIATTSILAFLIDGHRLITPAGVYFLASGLFVGVALVYLLILGSTVATGTLALVACATYASMVVILAFYSRWRPPDIPSRATAPPMAADRSQLRLLGVVLLAAALLTQPVDALEAVSSTSAYAGVMLLATAAITRESWRTRRTNVLSWTLALTAGIVYISQTFTGSGRLMVAGIALAVGVAYNNRRPDRWHKAALLVFIVPALSVAAAADAATSPSASLLAEGRGLASLYAPLDTFGQLVELDASIGGSELPRQYGATFVTAATVWVPREIWPSKPLGLGAQIAEVLNPQYRDGLVGHTDAALLQGEFYINFGWLGLVLMGPPIAGGLAFLTRGQKKLLCQPRWSRHSFILFAALLSVVASLADLVWGGTFTWAARGGLGAALLLVLAILLPRGGRSPSLRLPRTKPRRGQHLDESRFESTDTFPRRWR